MEKTDLEILVNSSVLDQSDLEYKNIFMSSDLYQGDEIKNKQLILKYLRSFEVAWVTSGKVIDYVSGHQTAIVDNLYNDGVYEWSESDIYHFEKYNMPLNKKFITHLDSKLRSN